MRKRLHNLLIGYQIPPVPKGLIGSHSRRALSRKPCLDMLDVTEVCSGVQSDSREWGEARRGSGSRFKQQGMAPSPTKERRAQPLS